MIISVLNKSRIGLCRLLEAALILAVLVLVLDVLLGILTRWSGNLVAWLAEKDITAWSFLPRGQNEFTSEIASFLLIWVALLGSAVAFGEKMHLGVDYFVGKFHVSAQKFMAVVGQIIILIFAIAIFIIGGLDIVIANMAQSTPALGPAIGLKMGHVYMILPIAGIFIILFTIEQMIETLLAKSEKEGQ